MKNTLGILLALTLALVTASCKTPVRPLTLKHYRTDIIVRPDNTLWIEDQKVDWNKLQHEFIKRGIRDKSPITIHMHMDVSPQIFDTVVRRIMSEGCTDIQYEVFRDEPPAKPR